MTEWTEYVQTAEGAEILGVAQRLSFVKRSDLAKFLKEGRCAGFEPCTAQVQSDSPIIHHRT
jgi:hypothetical protein